MGSEGEIRWEEETGQVTGAETTPGGRTAWIAAGEKEGMIQRTALYIRSGDTSREVATFLFGDHLTGPFWSPAGQRLLLSFSITLPLPGHLDSYETRYYTLVVTP